MIYTIEGTTYFTDDSVNNGVVSRAVFLGNSVNTGTVEDFAIFSGSSVNQGAVSAARFEGTTVNEGLVVSATFLGQASNYGVIEETAIFQGDSNNSGVINGVIYIADNAVDNYGYQVLYYSRVDGAYYDGYFINNQLTAPANYATHAYEIDYFWYVFDAQGNANYAHGAYIDNNTSEYWVFDTGIKIANVTRIIQDTDMLGAFTDGVLNPGTGDRWYFYGHYFPTYASYLTGKQAVIDDWCGPGVSGPYVTPNGTQLWQDYNCYNGVVYTYNDLVNTIALELAAEQYVTEYGYITAAAQNNYVGKIDRTFSTAYLAITLTTNLVRWIYNHVIYDSREAYTNAYFSNYDISDWIVRKFNYEYTSNGITDDVINVDSNGVYTIYATPSGSFSNFAQARDFVMQSISASVAGNAWTPPTDYNGPLYITVPQDEFKIADLNLTHESTQYVSTRWALNGTVVTKAEYDAYWENAIIAAADAWGTTNNGEFKYSIVNQVVTYNGLGITSGRFYFFSNTAVLSIEQYNGLIETEINDATNSWCTGTTRGRFSYVVDNGIVYSTSEEAVQTNTWCCDGTINTTLTAFTACTFTTDADAWGASNDGRFIYTLADNVYSYYDNGTPSMRWYCSNTLYTNSSAYAGTSCAIYDAAYAWAVINPNNSGRYQYSYSNYSYTYSADGTVSDYYICNGGVYNTEDDYKTCALVFAATTWGASNSGRYIYNYSNYSYTYNAAGTATDYWYFRNQLYTTEQNYIDAVLNYRLPLAAAAWGATNNGQFKYNLATFQNTLNVVYSNDGADVTVTDYWYCDGTEMSESDYNTSSCV